MTLRFAVENDIPALQSLYEQLLKHHRQFDEFHAYTGEMVTQRAGIYASIIKQNGGFILVEDVEGEIIAMMVLQYLPSDPGMPQQKPVLLQDVFVLPEYRKKGHYRNMIAMAIELCKKEGRGSILSWVATKNKLVSKMMENDYGFRNVLVFEYKKL